MKSRRILAWILLALILLPALALPAAAFPFEEFSLADGTLDYTVDYDYDTENDKAVAARGLMFSRSIRYVGTDHHLGKKLYEQTARLTVALPDGYYDYPAVSFKDDPEKYNAFYANEYEVWYNQYVENKVQYSLYHTIDGIELKQVSWKSTVADEIEKAVDYYRGLEKEDGNSADDYKTIRKEADGYSVILHSCKPTHFRIGEGNIEDDYDIFISELNEWHVIRFLTFADLPGVYLKVVFRQTSNLSVEIGDKSNKTPCESYPNGDWEPYYNTAMERVSGYKALEMYKKFLDLSPLVSITWEEPETTAAYVGSTTTADTTDGTTADTGSAGTEAETSGRPQIFDWKKHEAKGTSGEDEGVSVLTAIVVGVTGIGAAIGGAAAALGATGAAGGAGVPGGDNSDEAPRSTFRMFVDKDFGDALKRGARPAVVRARMAEITPEGAEIDRGDLTAQIGASGSGMTVHSVSLAGRYCEASVSIPEDYAGETADLNFVFTGEGGTFKNIVTFRVVGDPYVAFPSDDEPEGEAFLEHKDIVWMKGILGDGAVYHARFLIADAVEPPALTDISAQSDDGLTAEFESTENPFVFRACVKNSTAPAETGTIFAEPTYAFLTVLVRQKDGDPISGSIRMELYPEGLSVRSQDLAKKNDIQYVDVQACERKDPQGLDGKWKVSTLELTLAVRDGDRVSVSPSDASYTFGKLKGAGGMGTDESTEQSLAAKYEYRERTSRRDGRFIYTFEPNATLVDPTDGSFFMVCLPVTCAYGGKTYTADVPLRLHGEFIDPYAGWDEEYAALKACIEKFALPEEKVKWETRVEELVCDPRCATKQLRLTRKCIIRNYMDYWTVESIAYRNEAEIYDAIVSDLEWIKFFGDCAFSFLVSAYAGPVAEAIISPAKDYFAEAAGELIACWRQGTEVRLENFSIAKTLEAAGDNLMSNNIDLTSWRKAAATLGAYFVYSALKNYFAKLRDDGESDFYGSLVKAFTDMTAQGLKTAAGNLFGKWVKENPKARKWIGENITKHINAHLGKGRFINLKDQVIKQPNLAYQLNDALGFEGKLRQLAGFQGEAKNMKILKLDIVEKYLGEFVGMGAGWVKEKTDEFYDNSKSWDLDFHTVDGGHMVVTLTVEAFENDVYELNIDLTKALLNLGCGLFGMLYDLVFGHVPTFTHTVKEPADPPLPPARA